MSVPIENQILTPVGRLVSGDVWKPQEKDAEGNPYIVKNGVNAGQPRVVFYFAIAIPKTDPEYGEIWAKIHAESVRSFPGLFDAAGACNNPRFAYKITDGDSTQANSKGNRPCDSEGFPGNWILNFQGGYPPAVWKPGGLIPLTDPAALKRGYFIRIQGSVAGNDSAQMPGIYLNYSGVELVAYGEEIISGPDGAAFAAKPVGALPPGASATPLAPATPPATGQAAAVGAPPIPGTPVATPANVAPAAAPAMAPAPAQPAPPPAEVKPAPDFLNPNLLYTLPDGSKHTREALVQVGWTQEQITALPQG